MPSIRRADGQDCNVLTSLRMDFLREMGTLGPSEGVHRLRAAIRASFMEEMAARRLLSWVAEDGEKIVATSGLIFFKRLPTGNNLSSLDAYVLNMYTLPSYRQKGLATALLTEMIRFCQEEMPVRRISLRDTGIGGNIYERAGFKRCERDMELVW